jgi:6-phosphogluconolactonase
MRKSIMHKRYVRELGILFLGLLFFNSCKTPQPSSRVYIGTYTGKGSEGIYSCRFNQETGELGKTELSAVTDNPSFISLDPTAKFLYAVNELDTWNHEPSGAVSAFSVNRESGKLDLLLQVSSLGKAPAHISMDHSGRYLLVANYTGGNIAVFPLGKNGLPGKQTAFMQHTGSGANAGRQSGPHAHFIKATSDNRFIMAADLGIDKIMIYRFDASNGSLTANDPAFVAVDSGAGPRHFAFHPSNDFLYILNELNSTITVFNYNKKTAAMASRQTVSTLPDNYTGFNTTAEIAVDAKGRFLYASNRGENTIVQFAIDPGNGELTPVRRVSSGGKTPRNFQIDPTGRWLLAANQDSDNIVVFRIEPKNGQLVQTSQSVKVFAPVCISFLPGK